MADARSYKTTFDIERIDFGNYVDRAFFAPLGENYKPLKSETIFLTPCIHTYAHGKMLHRFFVSQHFCCDYCIIE